MPAHGELSRERPGLWLCCFYCAQAINTFLQIWLRIFASPQILPFWTSWWSISFLTCPPQIGQFMSICSWPSWRAKKPVMQRARKRLKLGAWDPLCQEHSLAGVLGKLERLLFAWPVSHPYPGHMIFCRTESRYPADTDSPLWKGWEEVSSWGSCLLHPHRYFPFSTSLHWLCICLHP